MSIMIFRLRFPDPFVLVKQSLLCNCRIEVESNFLLESLAACLGVESKFVMYFTVNAAFVNYLNSLDNLTDSLEFPILLNRNYLQTLPISLKSFDFDSELLKAPRTLETLFTSFDIKRKSLICKKGIIIMIWISLTKFSFSIIIL